MYETDKELLAKSGEMVKQSKTLLRKLKEKYEVGQPRDDKGRFISKEAVQQRKRDGEMFKLIKQDEEEKQKSEKESQLATSEIFIPCERVFYADLKNNLYYNHNTGVRHDKIIHKNAYFVEFGPHKKRNDSRLLVPVSCLTSADEYRRFESLATSKDSHLWGKDKFVKVQPTTGPIPTGLYVSTDNVHCLFGVCEYNKYKGQTISLARLLRMQHIAERFTKMQEEKKRKM